MTNITTATEKRIETAECQYSDLLRYLLDEMKCRISCYGASIKELKGWGITLDNEQQMNVRESFELRGLCHTYNDYISYVGTHDLSYVNIHDFNGLVKAVIAGNGKHNGDKA